MPAERRTFTAARPVKTERTHEENQERAYIAASRRSDRSLEARIESARRASEIHKKRTGRALRVTEQDVINEEMYEEEDDDLPTQYQRLNAHLHTTSVMFNKKLHDYIATQHGVRNMFMSQYQNQSPTFPQFGAQFTSPAGAFPQANNWLSPTMLPPQQFAPSSPQGFQQTQSFSPTTTQPQQGYRQSPYHVPQRTQSHQRALSIQLPQAPSQFDHSAQPPSATATTPQTDVNRSMSLPPQAFQTQNQSAEQSAQPSLTHSPATQSSSPTNGSVADAQQPPSDSTSPSSYSFSPASYPFNSHIFGTNPLTLSMPPESQQFLGSFLDPNDARTATLMAGSENLPQPFTPTYTYNPNKVGRTSNAVNVSESAPGSTQTLSSGLNLKVESLADDSSVLPTSISESFYPTDGFLTPGNPDYESFFDFQGAGYAQAFDDHSANDQDNGNSLVNWDE
ncbi:hypothetical protein COCC4DRAFT_51481 [Bipolaris maydis ATCC 48331]|uniref:Uncharacterized protein n=2 Tax=Cochliobolus heterostrophus TaxID=5016 RepID=M2V9S0_COCH5|nr:uncharacterized protein COCC4DRAFT_51481 [Bipolaris maydis ATCC 48331]EMD96707.1 hypothetical protein COCHEDRAFT_1123289 [Bipolaris maydis C5]KAH7558315.1 hypothetical protein BM1_05587 [Bipolaris maydis]ENI03574.1 hypothetical protein COCC4DRAFT_51481 [Bipolaris maydis ATCC 48331]KAJ5031406.1 hypothetical protein J3E73DRAFT_377443 [Bipolaris maydis]KAJ5060548.1 hypothetical protein J3E74DRAFT_271596 [Bipolaris maydis]